MTVAYDPKEWKALPSMALESSWTIPRRGALIDVEYDPLEGGLIPDVYYLLMLRFSRPGWTVYSPMAGAMTCKRVGDKIGRDVISVDIADRGPSDDPLYEELVLADAREYSPPWLVDLIVWHPPYRDIIKFSDDPADLSTMDEDDYWIAMTSCLTTFDRCLNEDRMCCIIIGDIYKDGTVVPLACQLYDAVQQHLPHWKLKGWIVKDIQGNRTGQENLWRYRACNWDSFVFKHETILVYHKP